jgi:uncharacterized protein
MKQLALLAIVGYKRYISPYKGFACAHRVHLNGDSCSTFAFNAINEHGLFTGLIMTKARLRECGEVYRANLPQQKCVPKGQAGIVDCDCDCGNMDCGGSSCCDSAIPNGKDCTPDMNSSNVTACLWFAPGPECCGPCDFSHNKKTKKTYKKEKHY